MVPLLIPTSEEKDGVQRFIYRSVFPLKFSVKENERSLDIAFTDEALRGKELKMLLRMFGFLQTMEIGAEQTKTGHLIFRQKLLFVDMPADTVVEYPKEDCDMCCRYYIDDGADELLPYFEAAEQSSLTEKLVAKLGKALITKGEVRPTDMVAGIALNKRGMMATFPMVWGYTNRGAKGPVFNARSETAGEKPLFKDGWVNHRCIIPASYFFEWGIRGEDPDDGKAGKQKTKFAIQSKNATVTWLAGIYRIEENNGLRYPAFTILTRAAAGEMTSIHDRMPIIFRKEQIPDWLAPGIDPVQTIRRATTELVVEKAVV